MNTLIVLEIKTSFGGRSSSIFPVMFCEGNEMILIDTGFPGQIDILKTEAENKGVNLENLTKIVITHHDIDHIGSLAEMKRKYKSAKVLSSAIEADFVSGKKEYIRLENAKKNFNKLPAEQKEGALAYQKMLESVEKTEVDILLKDNDLIPGCSGIRVISTSGHMPGHISLYVEETKTLIAGDAVGLVDGKLFINSQYTLDMKQAKVSIEKLLKYDIEKIICYHGGLFEGNCINALQKILSAEN